jgi:regulator of vacuolar morphogenesis
MLVALEEGLKNLGDKAVWGGSRLGEGELRRRKDLLANARKERDGLENLLIAMSTKSKLDNAVALIQDKEALVGNKPKVGRILGKETDRTRELDNQGILQLQKQIIEDQDLGVEELRKIVARQKELGVAIHNELQIQNEMLNMVDEDVDRSVTTSSPATNDALLIIKRIQSKTKGRYREKACGGDLLRLSVHFVPGLRIFLFFLVSSSVI